MNDTRDTSYCNGMTKENISPRFKIGDEVVVVAGKKDDILRMTETKVVGCQWDTEFGGWTILLEGGGIYIHEQNAIPANERRLWEPHISESGILWSYWTKKEEI